MDCHSRAVPFYFIRCNGFVDSFFKMDEVSSFCYIDIIIYKSPENISRSVISGLLDGRGIELRCLSIFQ